MVNGDLVLIIVAAFILGAGVLWLATKINPIKKSGVKKDLEK